MIYLRTESNEMFIAMYETEEPKRNQWGPIEPNWGYIKAHEIWQSSKREYKVRSEDKEEIEGILFAKFVKENKDLNHFGHVFIEILEGGIDCTFLKDRLKLENECGDEKCQGCGHVKQWTLLPSEDKKENEDWDELINDLYDYFNDENNSYPQSLLDKIKQKFTLTRKPTIQEPE